MARPGVPGGAECERQIQGVGMRRGVLVLTGMLAAMLCGCGGSSNNTTTTTIAVALSPTSATLNPLATQMFTATVTPANASNAITWTVTGAGCTGSACGT